MIFTPEVLSLFILNGIFLFFSTIALVISLKVYLYWDRDSSSKLQYKLEQKTVLSSTIIKYIFLVKLPLFLFFVFTLDNISNVLTGAMCAAGVVDATEYGVYLFIFKILNLYLFGMWLILHSVDISREDLPFTKLKHGTFILLYGLFCVELLLETLMFLNIDPAIMVSCCGSLYSSTNSSYIGDIFSIETNLLLTIFYGNFLLLVVAYLYKSRFAYGIFSMLFLIISIISLIGWFGRYIYELPTHHCPFCFLQKDYYYVGYLIYTTLFAGTFYGIAAKLFDQKEYLRKSIYLIFLYVLIVSFYPLSYYLKNGVLL